MKNYNFAYFIIYLFLTVLISSCKHLECNNSIVANKIHIHDYKSGAIVNNNVFLIGTIRNAKVPNIDRALFCYNNGNKIWDSRINGAKDIKVVNNILVIAGIIGNAVFLKTINTDSGSVIQTKHHTLENIDHYSSIKVLDASSTLLGHFDSEQDKTILKKIEWSSSEVAVDELKIFDGSLKFMNGLDVNNGKLTFGIVRMFNQKNQNDSKLNIECNLVNLQNTEIENIESIDITVNFVVMPFNFMPMPIIHNGFIYYRAVKTAKHTIKKMSLIDTNLLKSEIVYVSEKIPKIIAVEENRFLATEGNKYSILTWE